MSVRVLRQGKVDLQREALKNSLPRTLPRNMVRLSQELAFGLSQTPKTNSLQPRVRFAWQSIAAVRFGMEIFIVSRIQHKQ